MKHILFIAYNLVGGGAEKALVELLRHFDYSRYEVTLCLLYNEGVYIDEIPAKVKVVVLYEQLEVASAVPKSVQREHLLTANGQVLFMAEQPAFNLAKGRSLGFASATADYTPSSDSLSTQCRGDVYPAAQ